MGEHTILIVDDDGGQRDLLIGFLKREGFTTIPAVSGEEALEILQTQSIDLMISDVRMPGIDGLEAMHRAREKHPLLPVLMVTAYADIRDAVGAIRDGAVNYLEKPIDLDELLSSVRAALGLANHAAQLTGIEYTLPDDVIAVSPAIRDVFREAALVAPADCRILITGESGTGKEIVVDQLHAWSTRAGHPLVKVNCAALPENLLESELFGHVKGAFTGAEKQRIGRFEHADTGTIFLDEVAEMSPRLQAKLLRIIQDGVFQRVGSNAEHRTDARVVAATNIQLEEAVKNGSFREDLFFRLNVVELFLPPLRERTEDIMPLADLFAARFSGGNPRFSSAASAALTLYDWPGNVRELENVMERAVLMSRGDMIMPEHLSRRVREAAGDIRPQDEESGTGSRIAEMEKAVILQALREKGFNRTETARTLGISRRTLIYKLRRLAEEGYQVNFES